MEWLVYMILCSDNTLYTGITNDMDKRMTRHAEGRGAKYFRGRKPLKLVYLEGGHTRSSAGKREIEIKKLGRAKKCLLLDAANQSLLCEINGSNNH
ncbi:MAG: GIY-YIG nuclease family protein [bacterium]